MTDPRQLEKLLGGYATGTLTDEERQALFQASLEHQEIFEALLREEPVRDVMQDPAARAALLAALQERRPAWHRRWKWPMVLAPMLAGLAVGCIALLISRLAPPSPPPPGVVQIKAPAPPADALIRRTAAAKPALSYSVVRPPSDSNGAVALRFVSNDNGFIYVSDGPRLIAAGPVQRSKPYTTPPLHPRSTSVSVLFSRQPRTAPQSAGAYVNAYVAEPLVLTIPLRPK